MSVLHLEWAHLQVMVYVTIFGIQRLSAIQHLATLLKAKQRAGNQFSQGKKMSFHCWAFSVPGHVTFHY